MGMGKTIKWLLSERGMSVKVLSWLSGVSSNTLYAIIKRDNQSIRKDILKKIAAALGVRPEDIIYLTSHGLPSPHGAGYGNGAGYGGGSASGAGFGDGTGYGGSAILQDDFFDYEQAETKKLADLLVKNNICPNCGEKAQRFYIVDPPHIVLGCEHCITINDGSKNKTSDGQRRLNLLKDDDKKG